MDEKLRQYLERALKGIAPRALREEIQRELVAHYEDCLAEEKDVDAALARLGPAEIVGRELARVHRPRLPLPLIALTVLLGAIGAVHLAPLGRLSAHLAFGAIGLVAALALALAGPAALRRLSWPAYVAGFALLLAARQWGIPYEGQWYLALGPLKLKIADALPFLFAAGLAGLLPTAPWSRLTSARALALAYAPLAALAPAGSSAALLVYLVAVAALFARNGAGGWVAAAAAGISAIALHAYAPTPAAIDPALRHTDFALADLGTPGLLLALTASWLLIGQLFALGGRLRTGYPRNLSVALGALLGCELAWSALANLGWIAMPAGGLNFPFLSFGGTLLVVHCASIGALVGLYRRRTLAV